MGWKLTTKNLNDSVVLERGNYRLYFNKENKQYLKENNIKKLEEIQLGLLKNKHFKLLFRGYCKTVQDFLRISNKYIK